MKIVLKDDRYILNHCTKFLARRNIDRRHDFGQYGVSDVRARICEAWRFPIIDSYAGAPDEDSYAYNTVTFVYQAHEESIASQLGVIGTFANLYDPIPLRPVAFSGSATDYYSVSVGVPKGQVFRYKFIVDGRGVLDPINPQETVEPNGERWSRFFTHLCTIPLSFETWELAILERLVETLMPFQTDEGRNFLQRYYNFLDQQTREQQYAFAYRLDQRVGIVNYIDNIVAREERHHLVDYKICLGLIARLVRQRVPGIEPASVPGEVYIDLFEELAAGVVDGWDFAAYANPGYFLQVLRRHAYTGAFSHPKYGGNVGALGWQYLADICKSEVDQIAASGPTLFAWNRAIEKPLGISSDYQD